MSGNKGVNTHLSEIISEFLEPLVLEMGGGEITSSEEALYEISEANKKITSGMSPDEMNILNISKISPGMSEARSVVMDGMNKATSEGEGSTSTPNITRPVVMDEMNKVSPEGEGNTSTPQKKTGCWYG